LKKILKAIIVDDQIEAINSLKQDIHYLFPNDIQIIGQSTALDEAVVMFKEFKPDLIFLDIDLKIGTGFDFLKLISKFDYADYDIIFTTAFNQFAIKAIKYSAFDYLLKPIDRDELEESINRLKNQNKVKATKNKIELVLEGETNSTEKRIALSTLTQTHFVIISDIIRCEASHNYTTFYNNDGSKIMVSKTLKEYESILTEHQFVRTHQSHLVNLNYVTSFLKEDGGVVLLKNGTKIAVSRRKKEGVIIALKT
jgi:two-component system LytT family response regulator